MARLAITQLRGSWSSAKKKPGEPAHRDVERGAGAEERRVGQTALDDHLHVAKTIPDDPKREGQRDETERDDGQLQRKRRIQPERPWQRVPERERCHAEHGAPGNPPQLPARGQRRQLAKRAEQDDQRHHAADEEVGQLRAIEQSDDARHELARGRVARQGDDAAGADRDRRHVEQRHHERRASRASAGGRPLGEDQHEVQQERREQRRGDRVSPVEHPVETIEWPVEREREGAEKRDAQPEEMQRRLVARTPHAHRRADEQREEPDRREHEIHRARLQRRRERRPRAPDASRSRNNWYERRVPSCAR